MIEIDKLSVTLGGRTILHDVSMTAMPGEVTVIVGPNGSGKSTLLGAICGDLPGSGSIRINGRDVARMKPREAAALRAVLPQASALSFPFTVREVVSLGLMAGRPGRGDPRQGIPLPEHALAQVDLAGFGGRFYQELSGGEQQRVHLARALCQIWQPVPAAGEARWLILDEPVSSLDIRHQLVIMNLARGHARAGGGVVAVLHDLNLTAMFADRIAVMQGGRLVAAGAPDEAMTDAVLSDAYRCELRVSVAPARPAPFVLPQCASVTALPDAGAARNPPECPAGRGREETTVPAALPLKRAPARAPHVRRHAWPAAAGPVLAALWLLALSPAGGAQELAPDARPGVRPGAPAEAPAMPDGSVAPAPPSIPAADVPPAPGPAAGDRPGPAFTPAAPDSAAGGGGGAASPGRPGVDMPARDAGRAMDGAGAAGNAALPHDLSPWGMFMAADRVVKAVMIGLALASLLSWTIWLAKWAELVAARLAIRRTLERILPARGLGAALAAVGGRPDAAAALLRAAREEMAASSGLITADGKAGIKERVASRLSRIEGGAGRRMTRATGILASIGAVAPFVGLFGTVWGIMHAFIGISVAQTTNLAVVAPGIAEALLATALGLVAAIPAVVAYNALARTTAGNRQLLADAGAVIEQLVSRELDRMTAPGVAGGGGRAAPTRHAAE